MSYYDIDAILTDAQKIPCTFELDVPTLGHLDNNPSSALKSGTRVDLPLWLAELLAVSSPTTSKPLVTLDLPASLSPRVLNALKADAKSVDLRAQAQNFYALGARLLDLFEEDELLDVLVETFRVRAAEIGDHAKNAGGRGAIGGGGSGSAGGGMGGGGGAGGVGTEGVEFLRGLDEWERGLFRVAHESARAMKTWMAEAKKY